jgi:hypothetical protein
VKTEIQDDGGWFAGATGGFIDAKEGVLVATGLYDANGAIICSKQ